MLRKLYEIDYKVRAKREQGKPVKERGILVLPSQRQRSEWCSGRKKSKTDEPRMAEATQGPEKRAISSVIVFSRVLAVSEDCQPKKIATYDTHHHHIWRQCFRLGLRVVRQLVNERTEKGYSPVAPSQCYNLNMCPPEIEYLSEIGYLRKPFVAEDNVSMIVRKVVQY
jgi:hypothetical protein